MNGSASKAIGNSGNLGVEAGNLQLEKSYNISNYFMCDALLQNKLNFTTNNLETSENDITDKVPELTSLWSNYL